MPARPTSHNDRVTRHRRCLTGLFLAVGTCGGLAGMTVEVRRLLVGPCVQVLACLSWKYTRITKMVLSVRLGRCAGS